MNKFMNMFKKRKRSLSVLPSVQPPPVRIPKLSMPPPPVRAATQQLQCLADACGRGDAGAMLELAEHLRETMPEAADMWLFRAALYGNCAAQETVRKEIRHSTWFLKNSYIHYEKFIPDRRANWHTGGYLGSDLNAAGLLAFQPEEVYCLAGINEYRTMMIWQEANYYPPDEDGFGMEFSYNMFYLDEFFQLIPEVPMINNVIPREIGNNSNRESYANMVQAMKEAAGKRKRIPLWTGYEDEIKDVYGDLDSAL